MIANILRRFECWDYFQPYANTLGYFQPYVNSWKVVVSQLVCDLWHDLLHIILSQIDICKGGDDSPTVHQMR